MTERHEALAQTVEILAREIQDLRVIAQKDGENIRALAGIAANALHSIQSLERIVVDHQRRLDDLEK